MSISTWGRRIWATYLIGSFPAAGISALLALGFLSGSRGGNIEWQAIPISPFGTALVLGALFLLPLGWWVTFFTAYRFDRGLWRLLPFFVNLLPMTVLLALAWLGRSHMEGGFNYVIAYLTALTALLVVGVLLAFKAAAAGKFGCTS